MAAIGTIRKQSGLLIVLIGMAMVLFLLGDIFSSGASFFAGQDQEIGTIAGESIDIKDYELKVQQAIDEQYGLEGASEQARKSIRERLWQDMIRERVLLTELKDLGISVSADELLDQVKNVKPGSILYQYFTDPNTGQIIEQFRDERTGQINSNRVLQAIQNLLNSENSRDWLPIEKAIQQDVMMSKYMTLLNKGLVVSSIEANQIAKEQQSQVTFKYALKEFASLDNAEFEPSEADFSAYFNKHKSEKRFEQENESRSVKLALFELKPTAKDIEEINLELEDVKVEFQKDSNDTAFVAENADGQMSGLIRTMGINEVNPAIKDTLPNAPIGAVFGPFTAGKTMLIYKLSGKTFAPDSVKASHILLSIADAGDTAAVSYAKNKLDSLKSVAQKKGNFSDLAKEFSEDFGSGEKGGDLDWFTKGRMVAPFEKAAFEGEKGDMVIVQSQFGVHLIYITDQTKEKPKYIVSAVDRTIEPSKETSDAIYRKASTFSIDHQTAGSFDSVDDIQVDNVDAILLSSTNVGPMTNARDMVRWVFEAEEGDVSNPFESEKYIAVVAVSGISEAGTMSLEQAKGLISLEVINEKKAAKIIADLGSAAGVDQASSAFGTTSNTASNVSFGQGSLPNGLGREMKVLGTAYGMENGQVSSPIIGNRGVFVIELVSKNIPQGDLDLASTKRTESANMSSRVNSQVYEALKKEAGVVDNRAKFY
ncbi:peptidylprolyl isomerase [Salibacteraceae bacterium]|nr:peptidylprolyl isomerase [Salibacteraceae bacterium]